MIQLFAKKSCSACVRIPSSFDFQLAKTARMLANIAALQAMSVGDRSERHARRTCDWRLLFYFDASPESVLPAVEGGGRRLYFSTEVVRLKTTRAGPQQ